MDKKFELGQIVVTNSVDTRIKEDKTFEKFVQMSLGRYANCDWGDTCKEDSKLNDNALKEDDRLFAVYKYKKTGEEILMATEWNRHTTAVMFADDFPFQKIIDI